MLFNSIDFVIFFIAVLSVISIIHSRKIQHLILVAASLFFFYYSSNYLIVLLLFSIILDFYAGRLIFYAKNNFRKKCFLIISISGNLGMLGFFKYVDFTIAQLNYFGTQLGLNDLDFLEIALPIGISFYTFQTMSYTIDIYRGKLTPSTSLREFALFVSFFPQLVAGPILRASEFLPQLREKFQTSGGKLRQITFQSNDVKFGITLMALGFFKKIFFADNIAPLANQIFESPIGESSLTIWIGTIAFGIQIYCDFSAYSDMAIGAARILGFRIPLNFNKPYFATSPADFWRRWHISLSTWLRDYLYIPLGGNKKSHARTYLNLATVMFLGGLWHGASWNFVVWGLLHGAYLICHKILKTQFPFLQEISFFKTRIGKILSILIVQYLVFLAWIPFRVNNTEQMVYSMQKYVLFDFDFLSTMDIILSNHKITSLFIILFVIFHFISFKNPNLTEKISNLKPLFWIMFLTMIMLGIFFFYVGYDQNFIYFQF